MLRAENQQKQEQRQQRAAEFMARAPVARHFHENEALRAAIVPQM
jgi:hypothetical protein